MYGIGASKCVIGCRQGRFYCQGAHVPYKLSPSQTRFRFGNGLQRSLGTIPVRIPTRVGSILFRDVDAVAADVPLLLGLDFMDYEGLCVDNNIDEVICKRDGWSDKLTRKSGHLIWTWTWNEVLFTRAESTKLHKHFPPLSTETLQSRPSLSSRRHIHGHTQVIGRSSQSLRHLSNVWCSTASLPGISA